MTPTTNGFWVDNLASADIAAIADNLRPEDVREFGCWGVDPDEACERLSMTEKAFAKVGLIRGVEPTFAWGLVEKSPGLFGLWGLGTPDTKSIIRPLTRYGKSVWLPSVFESGKVRRIEVHVPLISQHSWSWLMWLGCNIETRLKHYGAHGEEFLLLSYTEDEARAEYPHVYVQPAEVAADVDSISYPY